MIKEVGKVGLGRRHEGSVSLALAANGSTI